MPKPFTFIRGAAIFILISILTVLIAFIPELVSGDIDSWLKLNLGEGYKSYLIATMPILTALLVWLTTDIGKWRRRQNSLDTHQNLPDLDLVSKVREYLLFRYKHRLSQKLAGRQPVNLRILPSLSGISNESIENLMTLEEEDVRGAIGDIFTRANGRLMLVGLPGSGKTTIVLQLALHLLERKDGSLPVILNLATWRSEFQTFEVWLKKILPAELGASTGLAEQIRKNLPLILLLDGLDEVPEADRGSLITAIGEYGVGANRQFLISSRTAEYAATKDARVYAQVEVAPLTIAQVEMSLSALAYTKPEAIPLLNALKRDPLLRTTVENPFYLNTAQLLFASGKNWSELGFIATDVAGRQRELVERFIEGALNPKTENWYPPEKAGHWLSFLASRMTKRNMVVFELRDLQYNWWRWSRWQLIAASVVAWLGTGMFWMRGWYSIGLGGWLTLWMIWLISAIGKGSGVLFATVGGLIIAIFFGLIGGLAVQRPPIITYDTLNWPKKKINRSLKFSLLFGLILFGIFSFLIILLGQKFKLEFGLIIFIPMLGILIELLHDSKDIIQITAPYQRFNASKRLLFFSIFLHKLLCYQLHKKSLVPRNLVKFLDEMSNKHILETDGATWRFRHRILQEYFVSHWVEPDQNCDHKSIPQE